MFPQNYTNTFVRLVKIFVKSHIYVYSTVFCAFLQVAAIAEVEQALKSWNIEQTDELLKNLEENREKKFKEEQEQQKKECDRYMSFQRTKRLKDYLKRQLGNCISIWVIKYFSSKGWKKIYTKPRKKTEHVKCGLGRTI